MPSQEEIRDRIITNIAYACPSMLCGNIVMLADKILKDEDSQGGVIKVECPDCEWSQFENETVGMTPCCRCNSTGYITESLIKEE